MSTACHCTERGRHDQPIMPLLHAMMAEVVEDVKLVRRECGHLIIGTDGRWTEAHTQALDRALGILGLPPVTDPVKPAYDVAERLA